MANEIDFLRSVKVNNSLVASSLLEQIFPDGSDVYPAITVPPNTANLPALIPLTVSKLQALFIYSTLPVTIYSGGTNAVQSLTISGGVTGGTFPVTFAAITSAPIAWNATAATVQAALQAMSSIGAGNVLVTGSAGGPWTLTFAGSKALQPITTVTASAAGLTGGTPAITPASVTTGVVPTTGQTFLFPAQIPLQWSKQAGFFANPIPGDVTNWYISNASTSQVAVVTFVIGQNA